MKDEKAKYLIIDATEINKQFYKGTRDFFCNDFMNIYTEDKVICAQKFFENNNVPKEFQKIIIKINIPFCMKKEAEEYTMGFPFDITGGKIEKDDKKRFITVCNCPIFYDNQLFRNLVEFKTQLVYFNFNDIKGFLKNIETKGYLKPYLKSINEFFEMKLDLAFIKESWNESKTNESSHSIISDLDKFFEGKNEDEIFDYLDSVGLKYTKKKRKK